MAGQNFNLNDNDAILNLNSPRKSVGGPYKVVFKDLDERWVIVALEWEGEPSLGIRWFWGNGGNPFSSGNPIWLVIPSSLTKSILAGLPIDYKTSGKIDDFLRGKINGSELNA